MQHPAGGDLFSGCTMHMQLRGIATISLARIAYQLLVADGSVSGVAKCQFARTACPAGRSARTAAPVNPTESIARKPQQEAVPFGALFHVGLGTAPGCQTALPSLLAFSLPGPSVGHDHHVLPERAQRAVEPEDAVPDGRHLHVRWPHLGCDSAGSCHRPRPRSPAGAPPCRQPFAALVGC